ncbi:6941_t:CDS:2 [Dentiscutata heterogama]|uniref:6941_t:CDS:1 n=1 Tax=Dentiscutata heterogama TaxID=1316150 RepID=A0ACA9KPS9_9GLOM|nr:6941_t:CDS:2 [Dentiscutata heterogama]
MLKQLWPIGQTSKLDYSNYIQENPPLTNAEHRQIALQYKISNSTTQKKLFQQHGIRWTCLLELPYIDISRFTMIDPMHNIFLGTSKHIVQYAWMNNNLPKLGSSLFNIFLYQFLDEADRRCWQVFVTSVLIWSQRIITEAEIEAGHTAMIAFLQYAEQIYGKISNFLSSLDLIAQINVEKTRTLGHYNFTVQEALNFNAIFALKLGKENYGSFFLHSDLNLHVLAHWQLENERVNWPGIIKIFIEHQVTLPNSKTPTSHYLAIVDWYRRDSQKQSYFYVKSHDKLFKNILSTNADGTYHAEL